MKKIYLIIAGFLPLSCETALFPDPVGPEREIVLQARILTTDTLHTVHAAYSLHDSLASAADLTIACYVNGECVAVTSDSEAETDRWRSEKKWRAYRFRADIHPGDSVRIEAAGPDGTAMARVKAPDAPPVPEVSLEKIPLKVSGFDALLLRFQIRVCDLPGQRNWYRLATLGRQVVDEHYPEGHPGFLPYWKEEGGWYRTVDKTITISVDNSKDSFLNPDGRVEDGMNPDYLANRYNMFTDELFEDGTVTLTLETWARNYFKIENMPGAYSICTYRRSIAALFDLQSLSREDYLNSRMWEMQYFSLTGIPFVDGLLSEDSVLPENVEGGLGLVTVRSVARAVCDFGEKELSADELVSGDDWEYSF